MLPAVNTAAAWSNNLDLYVNYSSFNYSSFIGGQWKPADGMRSRRLGASLNACRQTTAGTGHKRSPHYIYIKRALRRIDDLGRFRYKQYICVILKFHE